MFNKAMILGLAAGVALSFAGLASPASAMDLASVKAHEKPDLASLQTAQVCAASMAGAAYLAAKDSDDAKLYTMLAKAWVAVAAKASGKSVNDYIDQTLTNDMQALYDTGDDTVKFYQNFCLVSSKALLDA